MSQDCTSAWFRLIRPSFGLPSLEYERPSIDTEAGQEYWPFSEKPAAIAAAVDVTFQVDPGAYWPWVARFRIGSELPLPNRALNSLSEIPPVQMFGL